MTVGSNSRFLPALALVLALPFLATPARAAGPDTYVIDPAHSSVRFEISRLPFTTVPGAFTTFKGTLSLNPADLAKSSVSVVIDAASINTGESPADYDQDGKPKMMTPAARDHHLRSADFFDVAKYPTVTFTSTAVTQVSPGNLQVTGNLTIHGTTKQVVIAVTGWGTEPGKKPGSSVAGFRKGTLQLLRKDYGIDHMPGLIGDEVDITLSLMANKVQPAN